MGAAKDKPLIIFSGMVEGHRTRSSDNCLVISFATQELPPETQLGIFSMVKKHVYTVWCEAELDSRDVLEALADAPPLPEPKKKKVAEKSHSQKLREILFVLHKAKGGAAEDFDEYYSTVMDGLVEHYRKKVVELERG